MIRVGLPVGDTSHASCQGPSRQRHACGQRVRSLEQILPDWRLHFGESGSESPLSVLDEPVHGSASLETNDPVAEW